MPRLDEIRLGINIGYKSPGNKYIWAACLDCGKERWVRYLRHKPQTVICPTCASQRHRLSGIENPNWKGGPAKTACIYCGKDFLTRPSRLKAGTSKFCSISCHNASRINKIKCTCSWCGKKFERHPSNIMPYSEIFCSRSCSTIYHFKHGDFNRKPTNLERTIAQICLNHNLPYRYVGDGQIWIGRHNPDFVNTDQKQQVIEVFGAYWHPLFDGAKLIEHYKQYGFDCLIIWDDELRRLGQVARKLNNYAKRRSYEGKTDNL